MIWIMAVLPVVLLALSLPIFIVLLLTSMVLIPWFMDVPVDVIPQMVFGSLDKYTLLAVPFFIFAGEIMGRGGISRRIVVWINSMVGGVRGGVAYTTVGAAEFFGALSGSSTATVVAIGRLMYPALEEQGYQRRFTLGLLTSSGAIASIIPPSIMMILFGAAAEVSVASLFIAGIIPGLFVGLSLALYVLIHTWNKKPGTPTPFDIHRFIRASVDSSWALGTPLIILGGIYMGIFSPTEAAGVACVYGVVVSKYIYREVTWKGVWEVTMSSLYLSSQLLIIVAASGIFSWILTISGIPQMLVSVIQGVSSDPWAVMIIINIFLLVVGCFVDPVSAIVILTPLLAPLATLLGFDLIHFGIIMCVNLSIGMFTPPFGLNIFASQSVFKVPVTDIYRGLVPFIVVSFGALAVITYFPSLSLWLVGVAK